MLEDRDIQQISKLLQPLHDDLKAVKEDIKKIRQDQRAITTFFDSEYLELRQRVENLEKIVASIT